MVAAISLRPAGAADKPFLFELFSQNPEYAFLPPVLRDQLLQMQFSAQGSAYKCQFSDSGYQIVLRDGDPVGKIWIARRENDFYLVDIAILANARGKGIGSELLRRLQEEARIAGKPIRSSVSRFNSGSLRFHQRLGFIASDESEMTFSMTWNPDAKT